MSQYKDAQLKALGSSLKLLLVAEGEAHVCKSLPLLCV
jgi:3'-phosphoadenosine 5'-phosphosulfate (PAPS) 3'-phosphatase